MELKFQSSFGSIVENVTDGEIGDHIVLSGPNGAGKSNLLQAIAGGAILLDNIPPSSPQIRLFGLAQLMASSGGMQTAGAYRDRWIALSQQVDNFCHQSRGISWKTTANLDHLEEAVQTQMIAGRVISTEGLAAMLTQSGKRLIDFDNDDFRKYTPILSNVRDPFEVTMTETFLSWHSRWNKNKYEQWRAQADSSITSAVSDDSFLKRHGPAPWNILNETMALVGLGYEITGPHGTEEELSYEAKLRHLDTNDLVSPDALSSGEKTLLAVAMSLYLGSSFSNSVEFPKVLLLDEADASLHPSMIRSLLKVTYELFHKRYGVRVILTTHSPTTVALAPAESLYVMRRQGSPRLLKASRDQALASLTVGLSTLSVKIENRRQVFVESEVDESCLQELYRLTRSKIASEISLQFIASGKGGQGNSHAVKYLVRTLRDKGNDSIWGLVDRDNHSDSPKGIEFIRDRYSLENLILDPLIVGCHLLREKIVSSEAMGLPTNVPYFEIRTQEQAQKIVNYVSSRVNSGEHMSEEECSYFGGLNILIPQFYLNLRGHDLENLLKEVFPPLKADRDKLKQNILLKTIADCPQFIPLSAVEAFSALARS